MSGTRFWLAIPVLLLTLVVLVAPAKGLEDPEDDFVLGPGEHDVMSIPPSYSGSYDITFTSDRPVDMFIMTSDDYYSQFISNEFNVYEYKYEDVTSKTVDYDYETGDPLMVVVVQNPSDTETANVHLKFHLTEELVDQGTDAATEACCGSTILLGIAALVSLVSLLHIIRRSH